MPKIKLGARPKSFKRVVSFPMLDGTTGTIECHFKYRTRKEFGQFIDSITDAARAAGKQADAERHAEAAELAEGQEPKPFSLAEHLEKTVGASADYVLQILDDWNLDYPLDKETVEQLSDELPGATAAITEAYRAAINEGRLGN